MSSKTAGIKKYPLSEVQFVDLMQSLTVLLHPQAGNIPISVLLEKDIDLDILRRALDIEVQRNDSLRNRIKITLSGIRQSFLPSKDLGKIPFDDLLGKSKDEFDQYIRMNNSKPLAVFRGKSFRLRFFRAPDGRYGIHGVFSHICMDATAVLLFYRDLIAVYLALRDGKELPSPLDSFENILQKELELFSNKEKKARTVKFYEEYLSEGGPAFYAGVDGMRELNRERARRKDPNFRTVNMIHPLSDKSATLKLRIEGETVRKMEAFCLENRVSLQSLFQLGMRTHLSYINERTEDVSLFVIVSRRATLADMNSGGSKALAHVMRTIIPEDTTFAQGLTAVDRCNLKLFHHADYSSLDEVYQQARMEKIPKTYTSLPLLFTCFPKEMLRVPEGVDCEFFGMGTGHFVYGLYVMLIPDLKNGGYDVYYEYQTKRITREDILLLHENMLKIVDLGLKDPDITISELFGAVAKDNIV
ncbi:MAG: hypothetical protein IIX84_06705 [Oscillospiraceae bacterium]|nr:hypothetical protein [Oscillospiraceae bacterium]